MYKLYYSPGACSLAPHIALEEIGAPYAREVVWTDTSKPGMTVASPQWKAINPKGYVPALAGVAGSSGGADGVLTEANAILLFLARSHPEARLLPSDPAGEARCLEWLGYISGSVHGGAIAAIWRAGRFVADEKDFPSVEAHGRTNLLKHFAYIERLFAQGRDWAVPGHYSVADSYILAIYRWGGRLGYDMTQYPAWTRHAEAMMARPAVFRAFQTEGITLR